jgi:heat shock protein HslJ
MRNAKREKQKILLFPVKKGPVFLRAAGILLLLATVVLSCAGEAAARDSGAVFSDIKGKEWVLAEVKKASGTIRLDRQKLEADGFSGVFTLIFQDERINGKGAPNNFFGPYTAGEGKALTIGTVAGTLMAPFKEPEGLKESEYFAYLGKVTRWDLRDGRLELYSADSAGKEVLLIYNLK